MTNTVNDDSSDEFRFYNVTPPNTENKPGRRTKNPLGYYSSYNYQIGLYLVTPTGMDLFRSTNAKDGTFLNNTNTAYLVAQNGGINNTTSNTAPGFELDYYIDDLVIKNKTGATNHTFTNVTTISFKIIEPYGFSFISNLKKARDSFAVATSFPNNPTRMPFVLSVGFLGYDKNGNLMSGNQQYDDVSLDFNNDSNRLFNRYYFLTITNIKFKIDGKATVYDIIASPVDQNTGFGTKNGFINNAVSISASTVGESLQQLIDGLNNEQARLAFNTGIIPTIYRLEYHGFPDSPDSTDNPIFNASIVNDIDIEKLRTSGSGALTVNQVNERQGAAYDPTKKEFTFEKISIMQGISQIIKQSSYLTDALRQIQTTDLEPDPTKRDRRIISNSSKSFSWYTLSARVSGGIWDPKIKDYAYIITYVLQKYDTPVIINPLANPGEGYYGPSKRYEYWYTGQNSEVLEYEQRLDNNYFMIIFNPNNLPDINENSGPGIAAETPIILGTQSVNGDNTGAPTDTNLAAQNSVLTDLSDPKSFAEAKITILGDPDFLMEDTIDSPNQVYNQFYGANNFTISANGGQVFIELDFREAKDYNYNTGTLSINDQIRFWNYPETANIKGISYQVVNVDSTFSGGVFKQVLTCKMTYQFTDSTIGPKTTGTGPTTTNSNVTTSNTGFIKNLVTTIVPQINPVPAESTIQIPFRLGTTSTTDD